MLQFSFWFFEFSLQVFDQVFHVVFIWVWDGDEQCFMVVFHLLMLGILFQYSIFACNFEVFLVLCSLFELLFFIFYFSASSDCVNCFFGCLSSFFVSF
jgi:hypothetical protein